VKFLKVLVTGASGFIGSHLIPRLLSEGYTTVAFVRRSSDTSDLNDMRVELRIGDLREYSSLRDAVRGIDVVIHLAAYYTFYGKKELYQRINVDGTRLLAEEAKREGVSHFIYCSSTEATGPVDGIGDEISPPYPQYEYGVSKLEAERLINKIQGDQSWATIIRPTGIYGPGNFDDVSYWFIMSQARGGLLSRFIVGSGDTQIQFTHVDDVVQGFINALRKPEKSKGETFIISENRSYSYLEVYEIISTLLGKTPPRFHLPATLAKLCIAPVEYFNRFIDRDNFMWHTATIDSVTSNRSYSIAKAQELLGYQPKYDLKKGLGETINWYRDNGYL
jgi:dihydroflavonol-4-reductase